MFLEEIIKSPQVFSAEVSDRFFAEEIKKENIQPIPAAGELEIGAKSAISVWVDGKFLHEKVLFQKNISEQLPIASLTKLMTAFVTIENYDLNQTLSIPETAVAQSEDSGGFKTGEKFSVKNLLYSVLMESSNDAAYALSEIITPSAFTDLMNLEKKNILGQGNMNTFFANSTGLDSKNNELSGYSTAEDLAGLTRYFLKKAPLIFEISGLSSFDLYSSEGVFHHKILNTNELLGKLPDIVGGKTGETERAAGCLILVQKSPNKEGFLINVILGSKDRFGEMEKLSKWVSSAYQWPR